MSKGRLLRQHWSVTHETPGSSFFYAERIIDGEREYHYVSCHCLACAKADVLSKYGGRVDLRGWHKQGICGSFLAAIQRTVEQEERNGKVS